MSRWCLLAIVLVLSPVGASAQGLLVVRQESATGPDSIRSVTTAQLRSLPSDVRRTAQPNRRYHALFAPNDPQYSLQWDLSVMNVPGAWDAGPATPFFGDARVVVAILDTGVAYATQNGKVQAPDLAGMNVWTNTGEVAGDGLDNDGNGLVDDVHGWNFIANSNAPLDDHGHGTHIAAIIAAGANNAHATAGIVPGVTIMPLKVLDANGDGTTTTIAQAVDYAVARGAHVINLSLGGADPDPILQTSIQQATAKGVLVVAASGNDGQAALNYPARYAETISVGASQYDGSRAPYSNYGPELSVVAPGGNIFLDQNGDSQVDGILQETCSTGACATFGSYYYTGTSQAAAHVTATVAMLDSCVVRAGRSITGESTAIRNAVLGSTHDVGSPGRDNATGNGLVNIQAAVSAVGCTSTAPGAPSALTVRARATSVSLSSTRAYPYNRPVFAWSGPSGATYRIAWGKVGAAAAVTTQTATSFTPTIKSNGSYTLNVSVVGADGLASPSVVMIYRYRAGQLLLSAKKNVVVLNSSGAAIRTLATGTSVNASSATGGTVTVAGDDRYLVSQNGTMTFYRPTGVKSSTMRPFGTKYTQGLDSGILRLANSSSRYVSVMSKGSEARIINGAGKTVKRIIVGGGKIAGLSVATGDIDGDGEDEFVLADRAGSAIRIYNTDGSLIKTVTPAGKSFRGGWSVTVGDTTGDGKAEILAIPSDSRRTPPLYVLDGLGKVIRTSRLRGLSASGPYVATAIDLDGNGKEEVAVFSPGSKQLTVWTERGTKIGTIAFTGDATDRRIGRLQ